MEKNPEAYRGARVTYSNYNSSFMYFNSKLVNLLLEISESLSIRKVQSKINAFIYEFSYAIPSKINWEKYRVQLDSLNKKLIEDAEFTELLEREEISFKAQVQAYPLFYKYFVEYLKILSEVNSNLTSVFFPRLTYEKAVLLYKNDTYFYDKHNEYKGVVYNKLGNFDILNFRVTVNTFITYYHAYGIFINEKVKNQIDEIIGQCISLYINEQFIDILKKHPEFSKVDRQELLKTEYLLQKSLSRCNSLVNECLSSYGVLPKIEKKVYADRTLI